MPPGTNANISIIKKLQYNFPKMRGGAKAVWKFSKNSSDLVAGPFPELGHNNAKLQQNSEAKG